MLWNQFIALELPRRRAAVGKRGAADLQIRKPELCTALIRWIGPLVL